MPPHTLTFKKYEHLSKKKEIETLFASGQSFTKFPFRIVYTLSKASKNFPVRIAISVPKKKIKKAVDRNRIKRLIRESYRLNKNELHETCKTTQRELCFMVVYNGNVNPEFSLIQSKIVLILQRLKSLVLKGHAPPDDSAFEIL